MKIDPTRRADLLTALGKPDPLIGPGRLLFAHSILDYSSKTTADQRRRRILRRNLARLMREGGTR